MFTFAASMFAQAYTVCAIAKFGSMATARSEHAIASIAECCSNRKRPRRYMSYAAGFTGGRAGRWVSFDTAPQREDIRQLPVIAFAPEMEPVGCANELDRNAHSTARAANAAFKDGLYA